MAKTDTKKSSGAVTSGLQKLTIVSYEDDKYNKQLKEYKVQFNPTQIEEGIKVEYLSGEPVPGATNSDSKFKHVKPSELKLKLTLDGTGVSGQKSDNFDVYTEIEEFK